MTAPSTYAASSRATQSAGEASLELETALARTPAGTVDHPVFFRGFVARPDVAAAALLAVADVAATRYADVGLAARLTTLDPVVTASGDRLRFESFSACNGVHARFDLLPEGIESGEVGFGTTNVDINQPLRSALAEMGRARLLHLAVGTEGLRASTPEHTHQERPVDLPDRWVRGFGETPLLAAGATPVLELRGPAVAAAIGALPRAADPGPTISLLLVRSGLRRVLGPRPGSVTLTGASRLRAVTRVVRFATHLSVHAHPHGATVWSFSLPGARLTLMLSPGPYRGFSGEGTLLQLLAHPDAERTGRRLLEHLHWQPRLDPRVLAGRSGLTADQVAAGLAWLSASGRVGYDRSDGQWFHRELPVDSEAALRRSPRLVSATGLVERGAVTGSEPSWAVRGSGTTYDVTRDGDRLRCTCVWEQEHHGTRGPCKHVLAVLLGLQPGDRPRPEDLTGPRQMPGTARRARGHHLP